MKKTIWALLIFICFSCEKECTEPIGDIVSQEISAPFFNNIIVQPGVELIITDSVTQKIRVEAGKNRFDNVYATVENNILTLHADGSCLLSPTFSAVKVYVSSPNIESIRNSSEYTVSSKNVLTYPELTLLVENNGDDYLNIGNFELKVDNDLIRVVSNGIANTTISGSTNTLNLTYANSIGKFEGSELIAQHVQIFHRAENSIKVNPQKSIKGNIYSVGNVISYYHPPIVDVTEHYKGKLIFQ